MVLILSLHPYCFAYKINDSCLYYVVLINCPGRPHFKYSLLLLVVTGFWVSGLFSYSKENSRHHLCMHLPAGMCPHFPWLEPDKWIMSGPIFNVIRKWQFSKETVAFHTTTRALFVLNCNRHETETILLWF